MQKVRVQEEKHMELIKAGKQAKNRLEELAPEIRTKGSKGKHFVIIIVSRFDIVLFFHIDNQSSVSFELLQIDSIHFHTLSERMNVESSN